MKASGWLMMAALALLSALCADAFCKIFKDMHRDSLTAVSLDSE